MAKIDITSVAEPLNTGILQLQNGVPMDATLRNVADQNDTTSPLKLSTTAVQVVSPLRITTDDPSDMYLDCEDGASNNRFNITRNTASQQVNLNFASNPAGSTTIVGAIRTYVDGVNLSEIMTFREDGRLTIYNTLKSIFDNYSDLGTNSERFANVYALSGRFTNVSTNTLGPLGAATWINISSSVFSLVGGQLSIKGSGSTSATTSLLVQNSAGTTSLQVTDDRTTFVNGLLNVGTIYSGIECTNIYSAIFQNAGTAGQIRLSMGGTNYLQIYQPKDASSGITAGTINTITTPISYGYSLGTASPNLLSLNPSINNTGTYSGTFRGIYYNPTLTSLTGTTHIAFENTTGDVLLNTTSGNTLIGSSASNTAKLSIKGSGSTSATTSLLVQNSAGTQLMKVQDDSTTIIRKTSFLLYGLQINDNSGGVGGISLTGTPPANNQLILAAGCVINTSTTFGSTTGAAMNFSTAEVASTSGDVANFGFGGQPNMQSGNASFSQLKLVPNFTTGGTYSGIVRGIYYNPSLTSVIGITSHRAIETTTGGAYFNTSSVNESAILQADSTTQGFLPPRMTNAQRAAITTPAIGLMVYCTDAVEGIYVYKSTGWTFVA